MANCPVLTYVSIDIEGVDECEIYPFPIPDLFLGAPIILSGKYQNATFPSQVELTGTLATGQPYAAKMPVLPAGNVPVERVFLKQRLELLTSKGWLQDSPKIMGQVVALSTAASMPCAHTTMIAFETTPQQLEKFERKNGGRAQNGELFEADSGGGAGMAGRRGLSNAAIGALAVGGTIMVVGASAAAFGDVAATLGNVGAFACVTCRIASLRARAIFLALSRHKTHFLVPPLFRSPGGFLRMVVSTGVGLGILVVGSSVAVAATLVAMAGMKVVVVMKVVAGTTTVVAVMIAIATVVTAPLCKEAGVEPSLITMQAGDEHLTGRSSSLRRVVRVQLFLNSIHVLSSFHCSR
jgi:hypothetical protein